VADLELKYPPPVVAVAVVPVMWLLSKTLPKVEVLGQARVPISIGLATLGITFGVAGAMAFKRAQTTVNPRRPEDSSILVTSGIYRVSRNPMYVGIMFVLLGYAAFLASPVSLAGPVALIAYITRFQIRPEERVLLAKFGTEYQEYLLRVRRWV
jgi:protein-S-isoprenylcysteine O-methyltransferase Ste14